MALGAIAAATVAAGGQAAAEPYYGAPAYAEVVASQPVYQTVRVAVPRQQCYSQPVVYDARPGNGLVGTLLGGALGGLVGNQFGRGGGNVAATAAGAVIGAGIGNNVGRAQGGQQVVQEQRCATVTEYRDEQRPAGFDVTYRYAGIDYRTRLPYEPGPRLRVNVAVTPSQY